MEKLDGKNFDIVGDNISKLKEIFPEVVNGDNEIDFDNLRDILEKDIEVVDDGEEHYKFTWWGKKESKRKALESTTKTLRPSKKDSKNWDTTENIYIEGDNLDALKILLGSYRNRIRMIYIDPPYNTGHDFVYKDNLTETGKEHLESSDQLSDEGYLFENAKTEGKYHSNWLNMMYPRLYLAKKLLSDDGVIFISIDDNEMDNLKKVCDEIFGEANFVSNFIWRGGRRNAAKFVSKSHEYMLCYAKNLDYCNLNNISWHEQKIGIMEIYQKVDQLKKEYGSDYASISEELKKWYKNLPDDDPSKNHSHYDWVDEHGIYFASDISRGGGNGPIWEIKNPFTGEIVKPPSRGYAYSDKDSLLKDIQNGLIHFNGKNVPCKKRYLKDNETQLIETVFYKDRRGSSKRLRSLLGNNIFDFPKDEFIIKKFISSFTNTNDIVLDFFSGSSTTAHSVLLLNSEEENSFRKFIMIQLPEPCDDGSGAYNAGYKNICEIGKERIRRAGDKIVEESGNNDLDIGFKVFKIDESNFIPWNPKISTTEDVEQAILGTANNIVRDRSELDLIYEVLLKLNLDLNASIEEKQINNNKFYIVDNGFMIVCLDRTLGESIAKDIINLRNDLMTEYCQVVLLDDALNSNSSINIFNDLNSENIDLFTI